MVNKRKIINYIMKVAKIIENLNPMLLYVEQDNLEFSFRKALKKELQNGPQELLTITLTKAMEKNITIQV